jgi:RNA polymerase sigma-70 factor (ECF subfamily)
MPKEQVLTEHAFTEFVRANEALAYRRAWQLVGNHDDACEVVQDAFLALWQHCDRLRSTVPAALRAFLLKAVRSRAIDRLRARQGMPELLPETDATGASRFDDLPTPEPAPEDQVWLAERDAMVRRALAGLDARYRRVAELYWLAGLSVAEVAAAIHETETHTRGLIRVAREALLELLTPLLIEQALEALPPADQQRLRRYYAGAAARAEAEPALAAARERFIRRVGPELAKRLEVRQRLALIRFCDGASPAEIAAALTTWERDNHAREQTRQTNRAGSARRAPSPPPPVYTEAAAGQLLAQALAAVERFIEQFIKEGFPR